MNNLIKKIILLLLFFMTLSSSVHADITLTRSVSTGNDDAEEYSSNQNMYQNSSDLELVFEGSSEQEVGLRFTNITIPQNAIITNAYIQFTVDETDSGTTNINIYGHNTDDASGFSGTNGDISTRTTTSTSVSWNIPAWNSVGANGVDQRTPDLSTVVQEIVNRGGWISGNDMAFIIKAGSGCSGSSCQRTAESYDGSTSNAPLLHIEYSTSVPPIAEYRMDECVWDSAANTIIDTIGSINGRNYNDANASLSDGKVCNSGAFFGLDADYDTFNGDYVSIGDNFNNIFGNSNDSFTITTWIKPKSLGTSQSNHATRNTFFAKSSDSNNDNIEIGITASGNIHVYLDTLGNDTQASFGSGITLDVWHFVAVTYDGNDVTVTINNTPYTDSRWSGNVDQSNGSPITFGGNLHRKTYFNGLMDEVKLYDTALSATQINTIYTNENSGNRYDGSAANCQVCVVNSAPVATSQSVTTDVDTPINITLSGSDPDGDPIVYSIVSGPLNGALSGSDPFLTYTPSTGYSGPDSFVYQVCEDTGLPGALCTSATVTITITNTAIPSLTATDNDYLTTPGVAITGNFITDDTGDGIDSGVNISALTSTTNGPLKGTVTIAASGAFTYTPDSNATGQDSFDYTINDNNGSTATATVTIDIDTNFTTGNLLPFNIINPDDTRNVIGNYKIAGNTVLCLINQTSGYGDDNDSCVNNALITSNMRVSKYLDIDGDIGTNGGTWNSTSSNIDFDAPYDPARGILWAGLFWGGRISSTNTVEIRYAIENGSNAFSTIEVGRGGSVGALDVATTGATNIKLDIDGSGYADILASNFHTSGQTYAAFADVTSTLQSASLGLGLHTFTVANLTTMEGREPSPGAFGGWSLVVIYAEDYTSGKPRNISIYNGFIDIGTNDAPIEIAGFKLPSSGTIDAKLSVFAGEGEYLYGRNTNGNTNQDWMKISDQNNTGYNYMPGKLDNNILGNRDNMFDAQLDGILRDSTPSYNELSNNVGVDVDNYDVSALMTNYRDNDGNISSIYIQMFSNQDYVTPSMMAFSAELYVPNLCYDYTLDIDGHVLTSTNNEIKTPFGNFGNDLTTVMYLKSEEGDIPLSNMSANYRVLNTSQLHYKNCTTEISETGQYDYSDACPYTYNAINSGFSMYIGSGKTTTSGGVVNALEQRYIKFDSEFQRANIDTSFEFSVDYTVDYGSGSVPLRKVFTANDLCPPINPGYSPEPGFFNVTDISNPFDKWNLYTQTSRRGFNLNIFAYDANDPTSLISSDLNLSVEIEMIRADNFSRDAITACNDEHSIMNDVPVKYVHFDESKNETFGYTGGEVNLAYRSAALRIWYLTDVAGDGFLTNHHNCTPLNQDECIDLYFRDYNSSTTCATECAITSTEGCYDCLRSSYGEKVCSRDNFAIRPESFVLEVRDSNQSINTTVPNNIIANSTTTSSPFSLIAGYDYRFDINATSHANNAATPRYRQHFSPSGLTHYVHMEQNFKASATDCNDVQDQNISINVFNGSSVNDYNNTAYVDRVDQIGEYRLVAYDLNWTSVDWDADELIHHEAPADPTRPNYASFFYSGSDCITGSSAVPAESPSVGGKITGCAVSSVHTNIDTGESYDYLNAQYYPDSFDLTQLRIGAGPDNAEYFVYINTLNTALYPNAQDENMSYNIQGRFTAVGRTDLAVSNFVENCYAESVDMNLYPRYTHALPANNPIVTVLADLKNFSDVTVGTYTVGDVIRPRTQIPLGSLMNIASTNPLAPFTIPQGPENFKKDLNASLAMDLGYNFVRQNNLALNPRKVTMEDFNVSYSTQPPTIWVDLINDYNITGVRPIDKNVSFFYARAKPAQEYYNDVFATNIDTPVSVVVYCDLGFAPCANRGILSAFAQTKDDKWWKSWNHDNSAIANIDDGTIELRSTPIGLIDEPQGTPNNTVVITAEGENNTVNVRNGGVAPRTVDINLETNTLLPNYTNRWLIYDPESGIVSPTDIANNTAPTPFYRVRFIGPSGWAGTGQTGNVVGGNSNSRKNKRLEW